MSRIGRFPNGLLEILDARTLGVSPLSYADQLAVTFDSEYLYRSAIEQEVIALSAPVTSAVQGLTVATQVVPSGETWLLEHWSIYTELTAGTGVFGFVLNINPSTSSPSYSLVGRSNVVSPGTSILTAPGQGLLNGDTYTPPIVLRSGTAISSFAVLCSGTGVSTGALAIRRLRSS